MSIFMGPGTVGRSTSLRQLAVACVLTAVALSGCSAAASSSPGSTAGASGPASAAASAAPSAAPSTVGSSATVRGFVGFDDFPMRFEAPSGFVDESEGVGTRIVAGDGIRPGAVLVGSVNTTPAADLPADLAGFIRSRRPNAQVSEVADSEVGGLPAQSFTLTQAPGTNPSDLWCARDGYCFKLLQTQPMDMTAVRTPEGLVLFTVEYVPEQRSRAREAMKQVLGTVRWE